MRFVGPLFALAFLLAAFAGNPARADEPAWLGVEIEDVTPAMMAERSLAVPFGARVKSVVDDSPAADAGLSDDDVIIAVGGTAIQDAPALQAAIAKLPPGSQTDIVIVRGKTAPASITVTLAERQKPDAAVANSGPPMLMLDTGGHMALIRALTFTPDGKYIVSASEDKTIRIWDWRAGKTVRTIRGESGAGSDGKIHALALSADGKWLATGGILAGPRDEMTAVRLYDFATGHLVGVFKGHDDAMASLAFSPDSRRLVSGNGDKTAIVWDVESRKPLATLKGHTAPVYGAAFTIDGRRVVTGSLDGTVRLWDAGTGAQIADLTGLTDKVYTLSVDRKSGLVAAGDVGGAIRIWDIPATLPSEPGAAPGTLPKLTSRLLANPHTVPGVLVFSPDGKKLLAGVGSSTDCHVYDVATGKELLTYKNHDNIVLAAAISPDGRLAATGGGSSFPIQIWDLATGRRELDADKQPLTLAGTGAGTWATGISADGRRIAWGNTPAYVDHNRRGPLETELQLPAEGVLLGAPEAIANGTADSFLRASAKFGPYELRQRQGGDYGFNDAVLDVVKSGAVVASLVRDAVDGYQHRAFTFTPDGKTIISSGSNGVVTGYDLAALEEAAKNEPDHILKSEKLDALGRRFVGHEGDVWAVTPSADGKYLVTGSVDQTVRLWNLKTQELIVTLFRGRDGAWAMWTTQGYYTGSPGAGALVGWQLNHGPEQIPDYVRGVQLRKRLLRPDIIERAITLASATEAIKEAHLENVSIETIATKPPPVITVTASPQAAGGRAVITLESEPSPLTIRSVAVTVGDGKQETKVEARQVPVPPGAPPPPKGAVRRAYEVPLFKGRNIVRVTATNAAGESEPAEVAITHNGEGALDKRGTLWVLAVGVDKYPGAKSIKNPSDGRIGKYPDLRFAGADATAFADTVVAEIGPRHGKTDVTLLVNGGKQGEPTRDNIRAALERIRTGAGDTDTILILLAGHGENWAGGRYHFLPTDLKRDVMTEVGENIIDWQDDIQPAISGSKGRKLLFLDACYSGNAYNKTLLADADADRFVAFSAAGPGEMAKESSKKQHGAFTYELIEALKGASAALDPVEKGVMVYSLGQFVNAQVRLDTNGTQTPEFRSGQGNFVLTRE